MKRPIMHASDFSTASRAAFAKAVELARRERAELLIVHALSVPMPMIGDGYVSPETWEAVMRGERKNAQRHLDALVRQAKRVGARTRGLLVEGSPAEAILRAAKGRHARMLVMGTHGRGGVARFFVGSVASRVVAAARCPVLTVRGH